jgi:hypothetical protein
MQAHTNLGRVSGTVTQVYLLALTAAEHTIKMRAQKLSGASVCQFGTGTGFTYELFAS